MFFLFQSHIFSTILLRNDVVTYGKKYLHLIVYWLLLLKLVNRNINEFSALSVKTEQTQLLSK
jgi:hypothetical protein